MAKQKSNQPVQEFRLGRIKAAIWANEGKTGTFHNVSISRLYKDDQDQWQDATSFGREDLPLVMKVADRAHSWIFEHANGNGATTPNSESGESF